MGTTLVSGTFEGEVIRLKEPLPYPFGTEFRFAITVMPECDPDGIARGILEVISVPGTRPDEDVNGAQSDDQTHLEQENK